MTDAIDDDQLEDLIESRRMIKATLEKLKSDLDSIDNRLRMLGEGEHITAIGTVTIKPPNRRFNAEHASQLVSESVRREAVKFEWDTGILRDHLTPGQLYECMEPGSGNSRVIVS